MLRGSRAVLYRASPQPPPPPPPPRSFLLGRGQQLHVTLVFLERVRETFVGLPVEGSKRSVEHTPAEAD